MKRNVITSKTFLIKEMGDGWWWWGGGTVGLFVHVGPHMVQIACGSMAVRKKKWISVFFFFLKKIKKKLNSTVSVSFVIIIIMYI